MTFETQVGNPSNMVSKAHNTEGSARGRVVKAMENLKQFGGRFDSELQRRCTSTIEQIKNTNLKSLPLNEWRRWEVQETQSDVILRVAVRRTS
jgi:hypothetical protein